MHTEVRALPTTSPSVLELPAGTSTGTSGSRSHYFHLLSGEALPPETELACDIALAQLGKVLRVPEAGRGAAETFDRDARLEAEIAVMHRWRDGLVLDAQALTCDLSPAVCNDLVVQYAPLALIYGCWLHRVSTPFNSHTAVASRLLALYAGWIGEGNAAVHWGNRYARHLAGIGRALPSPSSWAFADHDQLQEFAFELPVFQLAIARASGSLLPELLGFNLANALYGVCPLVAAAARRAAEPGSLPFFADAGSDERRASETREARAAIEDYFASLNEHWFRGSLEEARARVVAGFLIGRALCERWYRQGQALLSRGRDRAHERMVALMARKAPYARGYHAKTMLQRRSIDDWFGNGFNAEAFVHALARSPLVRPGNSGKSSLLSRAIAFGGPMFRVFSPDELSTIAEWIDSLPERAPRAVAPALPVPVVDPPPLPQLPQTRARPMPRRGPWSFGVSVRELYHRLLNVERYPDVLCAAEQFASLWLAGASIGLRKGPRALPFEDYDHRTLGRWLDDQHRRQVESYVPLEGEPTLTRDEVIDSAVQLCPMVFIDGAWVQAFTDPCLSATAMGSLLFQIYYDEVGNGQQRLNHPNVYRQLMSAMQVDVPTFGTRDFAFWHRFNDSSFQVPTFWLAISQFTRRFLPEILGVNLAMELSGVGGSYRQGRDLLRHYGYDTTFIELHNTIDNVSTGHTALARRAIQLHMDDMFARGGNEEVRRHWLRVWNGYRALVPPEGKLNPILRRLKLTFRAATSRAA